MQIKIFSIPILGGEVANEEMNKFLRSNKIINIEKRFYESPEGGFWTFCINYLENSNTQQSIQSSGKQKVDYKEVLDEKTFAVFSRLREIRKQISESDGVAAYVVFTDAELSQIAGLDEINVNNMISIKGIGKGKVERYGESLCKLYNEQ